MTKRKLWTIVAVAIAVLGVIVLAVGVNNLSKDCFEQTFDVVMVDNSLGFLRTVINGKEIIPENGGDLANGATVATITTWYNATDNTIIPNYHMETWGLSIAGLVLCGIALAVYLFGRKQKSYY